MAAYQKYFVLFGIMLACVFTDQATKLWSEARLASSNPPIGPPHSFDIEVPTAAKGTKMVDFLKEDLSWTPEQEVEGIARSRTLVNGERSFDAERVLEGGETLTITSRKAEVIKDFFHFRYTRNPGAAFGFLSKQDSPWRRPFFIVVSLLAIGLIFFIFRTVTNDQKLLILALSLIVGGAIGNFIDRIAYGWVIDFIDWHYYREYTWPTFNLADAYISVGVALMAIEIFFGAKEDEEGEEGKEDKEATA